jgi:hypothetical protein
MPKKYTACSRGCLGWHQNAETGAVEACDACHRFMTREGYSDDDAALDHVVRIARAAERKAQREKSRR